MQIEQAAFWCCVFKSSHTVKLRVCFHIPQTYYPLSDFSSYMTFQVWKYRVLQCVWILCVVLWWRWPLSESPGFLKHSVTRGNFSNATTMRSVNVVVMRAGVREFQQKHDNYQSKRVTYFKSKATKNLKSYQRQDCIWKCWCGELWMAEGHGLSDSNLHMQIATRLLRPKSFPFESNANRKCKQVITHAALSQTEAGRCNK